MKTFLIKITAITSAFISFSAHADSPDNSWFIGAATGASYPGISHSFRIRSAPGLPADVYLYNSTESTPLVSLDGGYMMATNCKWVTFYSVGLNYTNAFASIYRGSIMQYSPSPVENYNFRYRVKRQTLLAFLKTNLIEWHHILPYITVAGGGSVNTADHYNEYPIGPITPRVNPAFRGKTTAYLAWTAGAGFDYVFPPKLRVSLGYDYGYFGSAKTDRSATGQYVKSTLTANSVEFGFTWYFDEMA